MLQKTAHKFHDRQGHGPPPAFPLLLAFSGFLVSKSHPAVLDGENAVIGDSDPMNITGQILQDLVCALDTGFTIDYPILLPDLFRKCNARQSIFCHLHELGPKDKGKGLDRHKEFFARGDPFAIR